MTRPPIYGDEDSYVFGVELDADKRVVVEELMDESELPAANDRARIFMAWAYLQRKDGSIIGSRMLYRSESSLVEQAERELVVIREGEGCKLKFADRNVLLVPDQPGT